MSLRIPLLAQKGKAEVKERLFAATVLTPGRPSEDDLSILQTARPVEDSTEHDAVTGIGRTTFDGSAIPWLDGSNGTLPFAELSKVEIDQCPPRGQKEPSSAT